MKLANALEGSKREEAGVFGRVDQQIKVALLVIGAGQNRSKDARVRQAVTGGKFP
jgi:hypothetical protein